MQFFIALLTVCFVTVVPAGAKAQSPVMDIVTKMKAALEPARPNIRKIDVTFTSEGETVTSVAREAYRQSADGKKLVMVFVEPPDIKGNAYLMSEPKGKPSALWMYMPFLRRIRELTPVDAYEHFLGTDFSYADLGFVRLNPNYRLVGEEDHGGKKTYKIEESSTKERAYYSRVVTWVAKDSMLPVQRDYYDVAGQLWKTETFEIETIDGTPTPIHIQMKDLENKSSTDLRISAVSYDVKLPDDLFDPLKLPAAADSPAWQTSH